MTSSPRRPPLRLASWTAAIGLLAVSLAGCGSSHSATLTPSTAGGQPIGSAGPRARLTRAQCARITLATLEQVAERVYREADSGRILAEAVRRLERSRTLARAVEQDNPARTRRITRGLVESQIVRVEVLRGSRPLAAFGHTRALAPARGLLRGPWGQPVGSFVVSVQGANGYARTVSQYTGLRLLLRARAGTVASTVAPALATGALPARGSFDRHGVRYLADSFSARSFPSGPLRVTVLRRASVASACHGSASESEAATLGTVAMRIYAAERSGGRVAGILRYMERSRAFRGALFGANAVATRAAIVGFFRTHLHVVRVRASLGDQLVTDVGGPFVLAPVTGTVHLRNHPIAHFLLAVQDDMGYMLLAHSFTGAQVLMRVGARQVMGTLAPGPLTIPEHGPVSYDGIAYQAFSFAATAFPSGDLRISLLVPTAPGAHAAPIA